MTNNHIKNISENSAAQHKIADNFQNVYFIGIGGIGMSNLARYFLSKGITVGGYDRKETLLTQQLVGEGALIHYVDDVSKIDAHFTDKHTTMVVYTPAIPQTHSELRFFRENEFAMHKRAQVLGEITKTSDAICIAGTHGKTTVSSLIAHILHQSHVDCNAFLGGVLKNYNTNLILSDKSNITVVEADEYDRSFHWLNPWIAVITSADPDHLDIYGTEASYRESFEHFTSLLREDGYLLVRVGAPLTHKAGDTIKVFSYSENEGDFHAENIRYENEELLFDFVGKEIRIDNIVLGVPIKINVENAVAAAAVATLCGAEPQEIKNALATYQGAKRRFDFRIKEDNLVFIDDYAHHPNELQASIESLKLLYPNRTITGVFQPHLYSRTKDFAEEFAKSLSLINDVILLDIYPAREEPIPGVTSKIIFDKITSKEKILINKDNLLDYLESKKLDVLVTWGAGDIEQELPKIEKLLKNRR